MRGRRRKYIKQGMMSASEIPQSDKEPLKWRRPD